MEVAYRPLPVPRHCGVQVWGFVPSATGLFAQLRGPHPGGAGGVDLGETGLTVVIERPLAGLFDGVDFHNMSSAALERQLLTALIANTSIRTYSTP